MHKLVYHTAGYPCILKAALDRSLDVSWALPFLDWEIHLAAATAHRTEQLGQGRTLAFGARAYHVDP